MSPSPCLFRANCLPRSSFTLTGVEWPSAIPWHSKKIVAWWGECHLHHSQWTAIKGGHFLPRVCVPHQDVGMLGLWSLAKKKDKWNQKPKMHFHFIPLLTRFLFPPIIRMQGVRDIHSPSDIHICTGMWMSWWHSKTKKHASKVEPKFYQGYKSAGWVARLSQLTVFLPSPSFSGHEAMLLFSSSSFLLLLKM